MNKMYLLFSLLVCIGSAQAVGTPKGSPKKEKDAVSAGKSRQGKNSPKGSPVRRKIDQGSPRAQLKRLLPGALSTLALVAYNGAIKAHEKAEIQDAERLEMVANSFVDGDRQTPEACRNLIVISPGAKRSLINRFRELGKK